MKDEGDGTVEDGNAGLSPVSVLQDCGVFEEYIPRSGFRPALLKECHFG